MSITELDALLVLSYHDHQSKAMLAKMARQMVAEAALPDWMPPMLQDLLVWEALKTKFGMNFNRNRLEIFYSFDPKNKVVILNRGEDEIADEVAHEALRMLHPEYKMRPGLDVPTAIGAEEVHMIAQMDKVGGLPSSTK
ncbi:unnamed protein product [Clonostachys byssicola]|uniref:Uncharacterized protein n=1 Tax=Clonostachys byssicola TaxID=160290 RepID=A0A9N9UCK6_9HYPO|nr:unnamed protein product [Clonostachys byssicola]